MLLMERYADEGIISLEVERVTAKLKADNGVLPFVMCMMLNKSRGSGLI